MPDITSLLLALMAGLLLGVLYFRGLWLTVKKLPETDRPYLTIIGSFILRAAVVLAGFYLVMDGEWVRLVAALLGFIIAREVLVRRIGTPIVTQRTGGIHGNRCH